MPSARKRKARSETRPQQGQARASASTKGSHQRSGGGTIVAGILAPHPPHLVYAENPPQNEPRSEGGWESIRWGYDRLRRNLDPAEYDVLIVHSPHWRTVVGHHFLGVPHFSSLSVDPVFPNLFRYHFDLDVDVELAEAIHDEARAAGLVTKMMRNPSFRVDYGTITSCHMVNPKWDRPIVGLSSNAAFFYFSSDVGQEQMLALGEATRRAVEKSGRRAVLLASNSLSHRHFTVEPPIPEDMSHEHSYHHGQYLWDMRMLDHMRAGRTRQLIDEIPDFIEQTESEANAGCLSWLIGALGFPTYPAEVHGYGTVIGTGNAVVEWRPPASRSAAGIGRQPSPMVRPVSRNAKKSALALGAPSRGADGGRIEADPRPRGATAHQIEEAPRSHGASAVGVEGDSRPGGAVAGYIVPGMPQPLLAPDRSAGWGALRQAFDAARTEIEALGADLLLLYSTQWISVIGHQIQAQPEPEWVHVDPEWHELGDMPYRFRMDSTFASAYEKSARERGLHARTVAYHGFPIDTGTVVALKLLDPDNRIPACVVSCNMYSDRAETVVLGKAAADALRTTGRRAVCVAVTALSNRLFTQPIDPAEDRISSLKDDEWNRKLLEILAEGRIEDVSQLARQFSSQAHADQKLKAIWWLASVLGQNNDYKGRVFEYQPLWGTGGAVVGLLPSLRAASNLEFDEEDTEFYSGERGVLSPTGPGGRKATSGGVALRGRSRDAASKSGRRSASPAGSQTASATKHIDSGAGIRTEAAPDPVGAYPHARRVGDLLYLSGIGPRQARTNDIPGGPVHDASGAALDYDVAAQTRAVIENVRIVLEAAGSSLDRVLDVTVFLIDMQRDFDTFNRVYAETLGPIAPTRTTVEVRALPTPIAVELKIIARCNDTAPTTDSSTPK